METERKQTMESLKLKETEIQCLKDRLEHEKQQHVTLEKKTDVEIVKMRKEMETERKQTMESLKSKENEIQCQKDCLEHEKQKYIMLQKTTDVKMFKMRKEMETERNHNMESLKLKETEIQCLKDRLEHKKQQFIMLQKKADLEMVRMRKEMETERKQTMESLMSKENEIQCQKDCLEDKKQTFIMLQTATDEEMARLQKEMKTERKQTKEIINNKDTEINKLLILNDEMCQEIENAQYELFNVKNQLEENRKKNTLIVPDCSRSHNLVSVVITIGGTHTGLAFSFQNSPLKVQMMMMTSSVLNYLAPTSILINSEKEFDSFGDSAENEYKTLEDFDIHDGYFFKRFLWKVDFSTMFDEIVMVKTTDDQKQLPAAVICSMAVKYIKSIMMRHFEPSGIHLGDIQWVMTMPNMWSNFGKQFMIQVAKEADIPTNKLMIVTEAEAAIHCCLQLQREHFTEFIQPQQASRTLIILNSGDILLEISAHEVLQHCTAKQISETNKVHFGIELIHEKFVELMYEVFGTDVVSKFCEEMPDKKENLFSEIQNKLSICTEMSSEFFTIRIPQELLEKTQREDKISVNKDFQFVGNALRINQNRINNLVECALDKICQQLKYFIDTNSLSSFYGIIMVGTVCKIVSLQQMLRSIYPDKKIIVPRSPDLAVIEGAVLTGHMHL